MSSLSLKVWATFTASWPVMASTTSRISWGLHCVADAHQLIHELSVDVQPAGGIDDDARRSR